MKPRWLILAAAGLLVFACSGKKGKSELEGTWTAVSAEKDSKFGKKGPTKDKLAHTKFTFSGDKFMMESEDNKSEGTIKVDAKRNPKEIDLIATQHMKGIYKLEGEELTLCLGIGPDAPRPTLFAAKPGSRSVLFVLKRE